MEGLVVKVRNEEKGVLVSVHRHPAKTRKAARGGEEPEMAEGS